MAKDRGVAFCAPNHGCARCLWNGSLVRQELEIVLGTLGQRNSPWESRAELTAPDKVRAGAQGPFWGAVGCGEQAASPLLQVGWAGGPVPTRVTLGQDTRW